MANGTDDFDGLQGDAPIFLRESLTFPYSYGVNFWVKADAERRQAEGRLRRCLRILPHDTADQAA